MGGDVEVTPVPIPHDCVDGFFGAFWRRPAAYLDPAVRAGNSNFAALDDATDAGGHTARRRSRERGLAGAKP